MVISNIDVRYQVLSITQIKYYVHWRLNPPAVGISPFILLRKRKLPEEVAVVLQTVRSEC